MPVPKKKQARKPRARLPKEDGSVAEEVDENEEEVEATADEIEAGARLEAMGFDTEDGLSEEQLAKIQDMEKLTDSDTAQDMALKDCLNTNQWLRYEKEKKEIARLGEAKELAKVTKAEAALVEYVNKECLVSAEEQAKVAKKASEYMKKLTEVRVQKKLQAKLRRVKATAVEMLLPEEKFLEWRAKANEHQKVGNAEAALTLGRAADRFLWAELGEMATSAVLKKVRMARMEDLQEKMSASVEKEVELVKLQQALNGSTEEDAAKFINVAKSFDATTPAFKKATEELFAALTSEARNTVSVEVEKVTVDHQKAIEYSNLTLTPIRIPTDPNSNQYGRLLKLI